MDSWVSAASSRQVSLPAELWHWLAMEHLVVGTSSPYLTDPDNRKPRAFITMTQSQNILFGFSCLLNYIN